jgi:hypothetical protein
MQEFVMKHADMKLAKWLTYAGTLPMLASVGLAFLPFAAVDGFEIARTYGAIIIAFLSGLHWASYFFFSERCPLNLLVTSNIVALIAWCSLLIVQVELAIFVQVLCFLALLQLDKKLLETAVLPEWFYHLRRNATIVVVLSLAILTVLA